jgi:adenylate cyclase
MGRGWTDPARFERLWEARARAGPELERLDRRIWAEFGQRWAIMFTDLSGFSAATAERGILEFLGVLREKRRRLAPILEGYGGGILKTHGDSWMVLFEDPAQAVTAGLALQGAWPGPGGAAAGVGGLGLGIGYGEALRIGSDLFGEEVNWASKLGEDLARPGEILVTEAARRALEGGGEWLFEPGPGGVAAGVGGCWRVRGRAEPR